jgi:glycosyltransferase involved in cell wall biosynthesis
VTFPWLTIVIPTVGRPAGLQRTLASIDHQPGADVEVLVVADTHAADNPPDRLDNLLACRRLVLERPKRYRWLEHDGGLHCFGQPQRTFGGQMALGEWVAFSQDDNILTADATSAIWMACCTEPHKRPLFFKWLSPWRQHIWAFPQLAPGNIDADCLVLPRLIAEQVQWGLRYEGDYDAAEQAYRRAEGDVGWREELIAIARPDAGHIWWEDQPA